MSAVATDDRWWWWAGDAETVDSEGLYEHGECATREEVIAHIMPTLDEGQDFVVIEATFGEQEVEGDEFQPFGETRNKGFLTKQGGMAVPTPAVDA